METEQTCYNCRYFHQHSIITYNIELKVEVRKKIKSVCVIYLKSGRLLIHKISSAETSSILHKFAKVSSAGIVCPVIYCETACCFMFNRLAISDCDNPLSFISFTNLIRICSRVIILSPHLQFYKYYLQFCLTYKYCL